MQLNDKEFVLDTMRETGLARAQTLQAQAPEMTGTELYAAEGFIPDFKEAVKAKNMMKRKAGQKDGFVCRSTAGRVVRLIQNYDSETFHEEPEELPAQWGFVWSTDPAKALPFMALATSPYNTGDCCTHEGHVWRSGQDGNVWAPGSVGVDWEDLGEVQNA